MRVIAEERGALRARLDDPGNHGTVVAGTLERALSRSLEDALAERPVTEVREYRLLGGVLQRDEPLALQATRLRGLRRRAHLLRRQAIEVLDVVDRYGASNRRLEHVLPEPGGEGCDLRVQRTQPRLVGWGNARRRAQSAHASASGAAATRGPAPGWRASGTTHRRASTRSDSDRSRHGARCAWAPSSRQPSAFRHWCCWH